MPHSEALDCASMQPFLTVHQASASYPVWVGRDLLDGMGELVRPRGAVFVVTGRSMPRRYAEAVAASFGGAPLIEIADGEANKSLDTASTIVSALLERGAKRDSLLAAVGGGMVGDTAGFAAAIFMRGIDVVQVPTTLLAQVDSAIGAKVAVNHPAGKNLIGAFHAPCAVVADTAALDTLPRRELLGGMFEALKGGVVGDAELFTLFESRLQALLALEPEPTDEMVRRKIAVKARIVSQDERESGLRRLLNYGHTLGHAIEAATAYERLTHGEAVGWGMLAANAIAVRRGLLAPHEAARIDAAIRRLEPPALPSLERPALLAAAGHDKKNRGDARVMVLPRRIGDCVIVDDVTEGELRYGIDAIGC